MNGIVLDTCLISEPKRPNPDERVRAWFERQDPYRLFLTATVVGELADGISRMPPGKRRSDHRAWLDALIGTEFEGRILPFDVKAALLYGDLVAGAYADFNPPQVANAQIAAVARLHGMTVGTRNVADFKVYGIAIVNPWNEIRSV